MSTHLSIKNLAEEDRPREKLILKGKVALSDSELIAILIGSGNQKQTAVELAQHMLSSYSNDLNELAKLSIDELKKFKGIGEAKAICIISALELGRRRKATVSEKVKIISSHVAFDILHGDLMDLNQEEFWMIFLKHNNEMIKKEMLSRGGVSSTHVDVKLIFKRALELTASGLVIAHNHPSGQLSPSKKDVTLTEKVKAAGKTLDIHLVDHLIITQKKFFSFSDEGLI